ncbi:Cd(II)/Pb(II)-responsive transcriptional regulator [Shewanella sp. HL-SH4]|uniref:Cd(II)/Pb(II)-responsive transcriptional regulator n=1 Tax=Shewanella TaxID=22 RepID=UPI0018427EB3|nr:Cd(II)/Pb(II)-responsive transcriptional regulator [Shewanella sp. SR41-2]
MKIGELAKLTGCSVQSIRFYEKEKLLSALRRSEGNYRLYDRNNLEQLIFIKHCRNLDITLAEIKQLLDLKQSPETQCEDVNHLIDEHIKQINLRMTELKKLKGSLTDLRSKCRDNQIVKNCGILQDLLTKPSD